MAVLCFAPTRLATSHASLTPTHNPRPVSLHLLTPALVTPANAQTLLCLSISFQPNLSLHALHFPTSPPPPSHTMASFAGETKDAAAADTMQDTEEPVPTSRDVPTLLAEHRESIDALKALVQDALPAADKDGVVSDGIWLKYDDIFFLRYILSFGTAAAGEEPVRKTIAYRSEEGNRELFTKVREHRESARNREYSL